MVKHVNELFKGKMSNPKRKGSNLPHKFSVGTKIKFGKKSSSVKKP